MCNRNKCTFSKTLDDEYKLIVEKYQDQIRFLEESIENNLVKINDIKSSRDYILEKFKRQNIASLKYQDKANINRKKLYSVELKPIPDKTCNIERNKKFIVEL